MRNTTMPVLAAQSLQNLEGDYLVTSSADVSGSGRNQATLIELNHETLYRKRSKSESNVETALTPDREEMLGDTLPDMPTSKSSVQIGHNKERSSSVSSEGDKSKKETLKRQGSKVWDTTNKVLGVHTVLGTAGLTGSLMTAPALGGGIIGGCATAAFGVATAASLVTGVGVIAGMGVAGVKYAHDKHQEMKQKQEEEEGDSDSCESSSLTGGCDELSADEDEDLEMPELIKSDPDQD